MINYENVKTYIVWSFVHNKRKVSYDILELQYITNELWVKTIYKVKDGKIITNLSNEKSWIGESNLGRYALFTSNSYRECLKELNVILESNKYNL